MKNLLFLTAICFLSVNVKAQLSFKNTTTEPLDIAIVMHYQTKEYNGWICKGWFHINPGELRAVIDRVSGSYVYYYAQTGDNRVAAGGLRPFLTDPVKEFTVMNADMDYNKRERPNLVWRKFIENKVPTTEKLSSKFTIVL